MSVKIDVFSIPGCSRCERARERLKTIAHEFGAHAVSWREVNVLEELDYAVALGVLTPPSMAIDGKLLFATLPTPAQLRKEFARRLERARPRQIRIPPRSGEGGGARGDQAHRGGARWTLRRCERPWSRRVSPPLG